MNVLNFVARILENSTPTVQYRLIIVIGDDDDFSFLQFLCKCGYVAGLSADHLVNC